jgi:hypothetical protein
MSTWSDMEADRAFASARARRSLLRIWFSRCRGACRRLAVFDEGARRGSGPLGVHDIPLDEIRGTVEPNRAAQFDGAFRPTRQTRCRWLRIWVAEHQGKALPPVSIVRIGDAYAVRDGHHRVSVAKAFGRNTIRAVVA